MNIHREYITGDYIIRFSEVDYAMLNHTKDLVMESQRRLIKFVNESNSIEWRKIFKGTKE